MKIGVLSDTHGFFDPKIETIFDGVEHLFHAGDIGLAHVINELENIAPVTAVRGNTDTGLSWPETAVVQLAGRKFVIQHIVNPRSLSQTLQARLDREQPDVVVFGHTHRPFCQTLGRVLFLNPGYAGKPRFGLARSVATLQCDTNGISCQFHEL